ncbi:MAG: hypothetical protein ABIP39_10170 [Polyangiaceae bacterium]
MSHLSRLALSAVVLSSAAFAACGSDAVRGFQVDPPAESDAGTADDSSIAEAAPPVDSASSTDAASSDAGAWPTCDSQPAMAAAHSIAEVWTANPTAPAQTWLSGVYVTAISGSACVANKACQIFVQTDPSYATLAAAAHNAIKIFISTSTSHYFTGIQVGDKIDALGYAWRYNLTGQNELLVEVNTLFPGCAKKTGTGAVLPIPGVKLSDLTLSAYEDTLGPVLVTLSGVSGKYVPPATQTFALFPPNDAGVIDAGADAGTTTLVSLSPYFLAGGGFSGLPANTMTHFTSVAGVFGLFIPSAGAPPKYLELYPRTMGDVVQ